MEPKVTDRVDAVSEAGASEMMREVNIRKRFALHFSIFNLQSSIAKFTSRWGGMGEALLFIEVQHRVFL
jgi:hypothetical protein